MTPEQKEMIEMAAKACGIDVHQIPDGRMFSNYKEWNPFRHEERAAKLYCVLSLETRWNYSGGGEKLRSVTVSGNDDRYYGFDKYIPSSTAHLEDHDNDPLAAWMHACTAVAADIGRKL